MLIQTAHIELEVGRVVGFYLRLGRLLAVHYGPDLGLTVDGPRELRLTGG